MPPSRSAFPAMAKIVTLVALTALAALLVAASESSFFLAAGSDAGVAIFTPSLASKIFAQLICTVTLVWALFGRTGGTSGRWALYVGSLAILALATHAVMLDYKHGTLREHWAFAKIDRLTFDVADGLSQDWQVTPSITGVQLTRRSDGSRVFVLSGIAPWRTGFDTGARLIAK
jgi:hypothetical protein